MKEKAIKIFEILKGIYPEYKESFLNYENGFQLLVAVILSAQCTDKLVNKITPKLFLRYQDSKTLSKGSIKEIEEYINSVNYYRTKARNLKNMAVKLIEDFSGRIPENREELMTLPGIGRKSANVVLGEVFKIPEITVDTHVKRVSLRLGFSKGKDPVQIEFDLQKVWPKKWWFDYSSLLILHGRIVCKARRPLCSECQVSFLCFYRKNKA